MGVKRYYTEEKQKRLRALREFKRIQHDTDTSIEKLERRCDRLLKNKYTITKESALTLVPLFNDFISGVRKMEKGLADLFAIINT